MKETSKAMPRRFAEDDRGGLPWRSYFRGVGLDVGCGDDPLTCAVAINLPEGMGDDVRKFIGYRGFDWVHGSQVLEHAINPVVMLNSWLDVLIPGGYVIATVPDFVLYEHCRWPSRWNPAHKSTWTMSEVNREWTVAPIHCTLPKWLTQFQANIITCRVVSTNYNFSLPFNPPHDLDQTAHKINGVEAFIEFVLRKQ